MIDAVQVLERDDRVVREASSLIRRAERERALEAWLSGGWVMGNTSESTVTPVGVW